MIICHTCEIYTNCKGTMIILAHKLYPPSSVEHGFYAAYPLQVRKYSVSTSTKVRVEYASVLRWLMSIHGVARNALLHIGGTAASGVEASRSYCTDFVVAVTLSLTLK